MSRDTRDTAQKRDAIARTAQTYREQAAKGGHQITQTDAEARVRDAVRHVEIKNESKKENR